MDGLCFKQKYFKVLQYDWPFSTLSTLSHHLLRTQGPSTATSLARRFWGSWEWVRGLLCDRVHKLQHLWGQHKATIIQTQQPGPLEASQGLKDSWVVRSQPLWEVGFGDKLSWNVKWGRNTAFSVERVCALQHLVMKGMEHWWETPDLKKPTSATWDTGFGATPPNPN